MLTRENSVGIIHCASSLFLFDEKCACAIKRKCVTHSICKLLVDKKHRSSHEKEKIFLGWNHCKERWQRFPGPMIWFRDRFSSRRRSRVRMVHFERNTTPTRSECWLFQIIVGTIEITGEEVLLRCVSIGISGKTSHVVVNLWQREQMMIAIVQADGLFRMITE